MYVLLEGIDTSGKSTQIEKLKSCYPNIIVTKEPGGTKLGKKILPLLLDKKLNLSVNAELFLFLSDRAEHYEKVIKPNKENSLIASDRGFLSGLAYAMANHKTLSLDFLIKLNKFSMGNNMPDKIVFFKMDKELLEKRVGAKKNDIIEQRGVEYLLDVQNKMENILKILDVEYLTINANESIDALHEKIKGFIND